MSLGREGDSPTIRPQRSTQTTLQPTVPAISLPRLCSFLEATRQMGSRSSPASPAKGCRCLSEAYFRPGFAWDAADAGMIHHTIPEEGSERPIPKAALLSTALHSRQQFTQGIAQPHRSTWIRLQVNYQLGGTVVPSRCGGIHYKVSYRSSQLRRQSLPTKENKKIRMENRSAPSWSLMPPSPACVPGSSRRGSPPCTPWCT